MPSARQINIKFRPALSAIGYITTRSEVRVQLITLTTPTSLMSKPDVNPGLAAIDLIAVNEDGLKLECSHGKSRVDNSYGGS